MFTVQGHCPKSVSQRKRIVTLTNPMPQFRD